MARVLGFDGARQLPAGVLVSLACVPELFVREKMDFGTNKAKVK